ncbi:MAG: hypothetical protein RBS19_03935 [Bacteroidales bacterium]|nr:hypothetical protein [Bacteroidales bacterium]MDY0216091.1 hypothetical protein [Bacteroidales bacterium]
MKITLPTPQIVRNYLEKWESLENYVSQENSLKKLFTKTYPLNTEMDDVLIKVCSLNDFYSTNIFSPFSVAKHIVNLNIDKRLAISDTSLVNELAKVNVNDKKVFNFYSFATKYCSHHKPLDYPIYDSYVDKLLMELKKQDKFSKFQKSDLKDYCKYKDILIEFRAFYQLEEFDLREIDKYLWQLGKERYAEKQNEKTIKDRFTYTSDLGLKIINKL